MPFTSKFHAHTLHARSAGEIGSCRSRGVWFDASALEGAFPAPLWVQRSGSQATREMNSRVCSEARHPGCSAQNLGLAVSAWRNAARLCVERSEETRHHVRVPKERVSPCGVPKRRVITFDIPKELVISKGNPSGALQLNPLTRLTMRCSERLRAVTHAASLRSGSLRASPAPSLSLGR